MVTMYCLIKLIKVNLVRYCRISIKLVNVSIWNSRIVDGSLWPAGITQTIQDKHKTVNAPVVWKHGVLCSCLLLPSWLLYFGFVLYYEICFFFFFFLSMKYGHMMVIKICYVPITVFLLLIDVCIYVD